jgi:DNA-binding response OmpR family regulator
MPTSKSARPESILVADDEPAIARLIASILLTEYRVAVAANSGDAVRQLADSSPDLLIVDASMNGRDAMVHAAETHKPACAVLYISGFGEGQIRELGVDATASNFLLKPFTMSDLFEAVKRALSKAPARHTRVSRPHA